MQHRLAHSHRTAHMRELRTGVTLFYTIGSANIRLMAMWHYAHARVKRITSALRADLRGTSLLVIAYLTNTFTGLPLQLQSYVEFRVVRWWRKSLAVLLYTRVQPRRDGQPGYEHCTLSDIVLTYAGDVAAPTAPYVSYVSFSTFVQSFT